MRLDDSSERWRDRQFYLSHPALNLPDDSRQTNTDHDEVPRSAVESDSGGATGSPNRPGPIAHLKQHPQLMAALFAALIPIAYGGIHFWSYFQSYESTDDARVDAPSTPISSRITGTITKVYVEDYQRVKPGQLLVQLDPGNYQVAVEQAKAQLAEAEAEVDSGRQEYSSVLAEIGDARARDVAARRNEQRYLALLRLGVVSQAQYDSYNAIAGAQGADVRVDQADAAVALDDIAARQAEVEAAKIRLEQAILNLGYVRIVAPADGIVGRTVELGQRVEPGQSLMALIQVNDLWVTARFKATQLARMRRGQAVTIHVDAIDRDFRGHVQSIFENTGTLYGLLPSEAITGNYLKVVRIAFDPGQDFSRLRRACPPSQLFG